MTSASRRTSLSLNGKLKDVLREVLDIYLHVPRAGGHRAARHAVARRVPAPASEARTATGEFVLPCTWPQAVPPPVSNL